MLGLPTAIDISVDSVVSLGGWYGALGLPTAIDISVDSVVSLGGWYGVLGLPTAIDISVDCGQSGRVVWGVGAPDCYRH